MAFDPKAFRDTATFEKPHQYSTGVKYLFVNGKLVIDGGDCKEVLAGKHTDFFHKRPTTYTKKAKAITADDLFG